jgi:hypothetical protein
MEKAEVNPRERRREAAVVSFMVSAGVCGSSCWGVSRDGGLCSCRHRRSTERRGAVKVKRKEFHLAWRQKSSFLKERKKCKRSRDEYTLFQNFQGNLQADSKMKDSTREDRKVPSFITLPFLIVVAYLSPVF